MELIGSVYEHENVFHGVKLLLIGTCGRNGPEMTVIGSDPSPMFIKALIFQKRT